LVYCFSTEAPSKYIFIMSIAASAQNWGLCTDEPTDALEWKPELRAAYTLRSVQLLG
jgi:hypothetical protein